MFKTSLIAVPLLVLSLLANSQPSFKGGANAVNDFITQKIVYPEYSKLNCIPGTIKVSFRLDKKGNVINAIVQQGLGIDLDDEALRVVKLTSGKWIIPDDYNSALIVLPIRFSPDQTKCGSVSSADINQAIAAYKVRERLQDAVTNYYSAKYLGKADTTQENAIINLKNQLGYNDEFINDVLDQAKTKLGQGDKEGACHDWLFIRNIGSNRADVFLAKYCK